MNPLRRVFLHNWPLKLLSLLLAFVLWTVYTSEPRSEIGVQVALEFQNVPDNLVISPASDVPTLAHIRLRGRSSLLRRISPGDLSVSLDLAGAKPGPLSFSLQPGMIEAPAGAQVVQISPSHIRVTLVNRSAAP